MISTWARSTILSAGRGRSKTPIISWKVIFPSLPITRLSNGLQQVIDAARLKAKYALSYADCFSVATALEQEAPLVTGDPEFRKVRDLIELEFI